MRIIIKIGTSTLTHSTGSLNIRRTEELCKTISDLKNCGHEIVLVSSGAIGMGVGRLHLPGRPSDMPTKQAAAAVGQCEMMYTYDRMFDMYNHVSAQILVSGEDVKEPHRKANFENTVRRLLELGAIPVINENDAVVTDEIGVETTISENDTLSAIVACCAGADLLIILSDINGLYTADPRRDPNAVLIPLVREITPEVEALAGSAGTSLGTGGMSTKLSAAKLCMAAGIDMIIINGSSPEALYDAVEGKCVGTRFTSRGGADT
ncbi:MAG: glutamate 5-kinase [Oscillospiraceae bacterium]|nr:glutamate 5-kinase [Oscillospiraceae bacterium]